MNKSKFVKRVAMTAEITEEQANKAVEAFAEVLAEAFANCEDLLLPSLGNFHRHVMQPQIIPQGRCRTPTMIKERSSYHFSGTTKFRDLVNSKIQEKAQSET